MPWLGTLQPKPQSNAMQISRQLNDSIGQVFSLWQLGQKMKLQSGILDAVRGGMDPQEAILAATEGQSGMLSPDLMRLAMGGQMGGGQSNTGLLRFADDDYTQGMSALAAIDRGIYSQRSKPGEERNDLLLDDLVSQRERAARDADNRRVVYQEATQGNRLALTADQMTAEQDRQAAEDEAARRRLIDYQDRAAFMQQRDQGVVNVGTPRYAELAKARGWDQPYQPGAPGGPPSVTPSAPPTPRPKAKAKKKQLTADSPEAKAIWEESGHNRVKAEQIARQRGYVW